jgi:gliding motility-associated-like protein
MAEIFIDSAYKRPPVLINLDNPLINCDPALANGQLSAYAYNFLVGGFTFDWYNGSKVEGTAITGDNVQNNLLLRQGIGFYTVRVISDTTACYSDLSGEITDGRFYPPVPTVEVVQDRADCVNPDGWLTASVDGITFNYSFDWYDGGTVDGSIDFTGIDYQNLDIGQYAVTAMDQVTGCVSDPQVAEIKDIRVIPTITFKATASYCRDAIATGTGMAELQLNPADQVAEDIVWLDENGSVAGTGGYITEQFPGFYTAYVTTSFGCETEGTTEIPTEILTYNLVTTNSDAKNDKFQVDCLSLFPNNNVKIFNRSGVLVYEADGYNNDDVVFSGHGEKGAYIAGNLLPVGTYFYIIDKRDGTKPRTGFLELAR